MEQTIIILGSGPAGLAAAIAARSRDKRALVIGNPVESSALARAERVDNYPGLPGLTGMELMDKLKSHALSKGAEFITGRVIAAMSWGDSYALSVGSEVYQAGALVLAPGVVQTAKYPGEEGLLGRGVSYCATCDGMLYRGREVVVVGRADDAAAEANFLQSIGCKVTYIDTERPKELDDGIGFLSLGKLEVTGTDRVDGILLDGKAHPCDGVFFLRKAVAPADLLAGLETENGAIRVDRSMATNLPGVFAAGDCTGRPYQVAKAVGEGLVAGECAAEYLDSKNK
ncbi:MAG: thioredoxin reductase [Ruminococcaceae bacterium]|nr:thioredoxin reductase [Oscillospiraceae bacterium]